MRVRPSARWELPDLRTLIALLMTEHQADRASRNSWAVTCNRVFASRSGYDASASAIPASRARSADSTSAVATACGTPQLTASATRPSRVTRSIRNPRLTLIPDMALRGQERGRGHDVVDRGHSREPVFVVQHGQVLRMPVGVHEGDCEDHLPQENQELRSDICRMGPQQIRDPSVGRVIHAPAGLGVLA